MSKGACIRFYGTLVLIFIVLTGLKGQNTDQNLIRLMFYNVENFFDTYDDSLRADNDFLPDGVMRWNYSRYSGKINSVYKVITAAGEWTPPDIVGFCEVENRKVLEDLTANTYFSRFKYDIIHEESQDERGIDVCLIYRTDIVKLLSYRYMIPSNYTKETFSSRSILYSKWLLRGDTIHLFLNHWPSRRGGVLAGEPLRESISMMLKTRTDSIQYKSDGLAKIIIAGDFNCTPSDNEIALLIKDDNPSNKLINLTADLSEKGFGTYRYQGRWEMIDQIIVSETLTGNSQGIYTGPGMVTIFKPDFLLTRDPTYPGNKPFSTYSGYKYQGGFSDHLPLLLLIKFRK